MGHVNKGLDTSFIHGLSHLIQKQGQNERRGKGKQKIQARQHEGVAQQPEKIRIHKKVFEVIKADPFAFPEAEIWRIVFKCDQDAPHRQVFENQKIKQTGNKKKIKPFVPFERSHPADAFSSSENR